MPCINANVKRLPPAIREGVNNLLAQGRTLDEIKSKLNELDGAGASPPAPDRNKLDMDKIAKEMRESRQLAEAIIRDLDNAPESKTARLNIELLENAVFTLRNFEDLDAKQVAELSRAVKNLVAARTADAALAMKLKEEGRKEAEEAMRQAAVELESDGERLSPMEMFNRIKKLYRADSMP